MKRACDGLYATELRAELAQYRRIKPVFLYQNARRKALGRVVRRDPDFCLAQDRPVIKLWRDQMHRTAGLGIAGGLIFLFIGGELAVRLGAVPIAKSLGMSEALIGLTVIAIGTSLPELGAGLAAAFRRRADVIIGNVIGSNIFNLAGAGAIIALFGPTDLAPTFPQFDHWFMAAAAITLGLFVIPRNKITRLAALAMGLTYGIYLYGLVNGWNIAGGVESLLGGN